MPVQLELIGLKSASAQINNPPALTGHLRSPQTNAATVNAKGDAMRDLVLGFAGLDATATPFGL